MNKILKLILLICANIILVVFISIFNTKGWNVPAIIAGGVFGTTLPLIIPCIQDLTDNTNWKMTIRKFKRANIINKDTIVRISFAYLFRIKAGDKYLLVKNARNTGKFQPVGGVYKLNNEEKMFLKNKFHVIDDNNISNDACSRNDYRLRMKVKYLKSFVKRFNKTANRERLHDLSREFKEELIENGILNWKSIQYRVCGRHITNFEFNEHFQTYEVLIADIVELIPTEEQENDLLKLFRADTNYYIFATEDDIKHLGVNTTNDDLREVIADHSIKILQSTETSLVKLPKNGQTYTVSLL